METMQCAEIFIFIAVQERKIPASIEFKTSLTRLLFSFVHASIKIFMFECAIKERKFFFADKIKNSIDLSIPTFLCSFLYARTPVLSFLYSCSCSLYNETLTWLVKVC